MLPKKVNILQGRPQGMGNSVFSLVGCHSQVRGFKEEFVGKPKVKKIDKN